MYEYFFGSSENNEDNKVKIITEIDFSKMRQEKGYNMVYHLYKCNPQLVGVIKREDTNANLKKQFHPWTQDDCQDITCHPHIEWTYVKENDVILMEHDYKNPINYLKTCDMIINSEYYDNIKEYVTIKEVDCNKTMVLTPYLMADVHHLYEYYYFNIDDKNKFDKLNILSWISSLNEFEINPTEKFVMCQNYGPVSEILKIL